MPQHLHILGICGTFMGGVALLAREQGWTVSGCDANVYPPMSDQLRAAGIELHEGYDGEHLPEDALIVVGNALSRGNPAVEAVLDAGMPYVSGPQWLSEHFLAGRWVLAAAGTHGKTTVSSMLAWILDYAGMEPGFLIGGVPQNFGASARGGGGSFFVVEADEYDTAFFDKRAKFVHYRPRTLIVNNLEFDHADIYPDLPAIQRQFHHLVRCVPGNGLIVTPRNDAVVDAMLDLGCWTPTTSIGTSDAPGWRAELLTDDGTQWRFTTPSGDVHDVSWTQRGLHNVLNALGACAAARHVGVPPTHAAAALAEFRGVKRRLELLGEPHGVRVFDDFAHHPTAIAKTLDALKGNARRKRLLAVIEPRSNTMRMGEHRQQLASSTDKADAVFWYEPSGLDWSLDEIVAHGAAPAHVFGDLEELIAAIVAKASPGDDVVIMSNGGFGGIHGRLVDALSADPQR